MTEEIEIHEEELAEERSPLLKSLRRVLLAGIGAVSLAQEEIDEFVDKLVERGEIAEKDGRDLINDIIKKRRKKAQRAEEGMEKRFERLLNRMNVPTRRDVQELSAKIALLEEKIDSLKKK